METTLTLFIGFFTMLLAIHQSLHGTEELLGPYRPVASTS